MWRRLWPRDNAVTAALAAALLSFAFWLLVIGLGFDEKADDWPGAYETYFQQVNWWPVPFFFLALALALWLTWEPMLRAWGHLAETGVLLGPGGKPDDPSLQQVLRALRSKRAGALLPALAVAVFVNVADWLPRHHVYAESATLGQQLKFACKYPGPAVRWIFEEDPVEAEEHCPPSVTPASPGGDRPGIAPPAEQILFIAILMGQQFLLVLFAALAVMQLLLHTLLFAVFERLAVAQAQGLHLMLNCRSPLNEFGLEHWNHALNNFYWAASPAMLGVFLSRASTPPEDYLPGQVLLGIAVPACLIAPMIATIIARQARLPSAWSTIQPAGPTTPEDYQRQLLWPLDRNWSSKLGIVLAFALAALSLGFELTQIMRL